MTGAALPQYWQQIPEGDICGACLYGTTMRVPTPDRRKMTWGVGKNTEHTADYAIHFHPDGTVTWRWES